MRTNVNVRLALKVNNVPQWKLSKALGIGENTLYRRIREELPEDEQERLIQTIEEIARGEK